MAFKLSSFCRDAGTKLIADYFTSVLREGFPASDLPTKPKARARFLREQIEGLPDDKNRRAIGDFRRVERLCGAAGQESLRQCLDPGDWNRIIKPQESAPQRALFCWLHRREAFLTAEFRHALKIRRQSLQDAAAFDSLPRRHPAQLELDSAAQDLINDLIKTALANRIRRDTGCTFLAATVLSEAAKEPEQVYQLGIRWTDGTVGQFQPQPDGSAYNMIDVSQIITLTYFPSSGRIIVTGKKLKDEDFEAIANLFAARVLLTPRKPLPAALDLILPEALLADRPFKLPPRSIVERVSFDRIVLVLPTSRRPVPIPLEPSVPVRQSIARHLGEGFTRSKFAVSEVRTIGLEIHLMPDKVTGKMRKFRIDVSSTGLKVWSALDSDLLLAEELLELNGVLVRVGDAPLLAARAG
jgi:hypothetical protein